MRTLITTAAAAAFALALGACTQGTNEEAGESADTAAEQATTGETNMGQGPAEEAGEQADEASEGATGMGDTTTTNPPPATTP
jgi:hypothetical protein